MYTNVYVYIRVYLCIYTCVSMYICIHILHSTYVIVGDPLPQKALTGIKPPLYLGQLPGRWRGREVGTARIRVGQLEDMQVDIWLISVTPISWLYDICMYVYMHTYIYIYTHHVCICVSFYIHVHTSYTICKCLHMILLIYVHTYAYMYDTGPWWWTIWFWVYHPVLVKPNPTD